MTANLLGRTVEEVLGRVLESAPDRLFVVNPSEAVLEQLVCTAIEGVDGIPEIRILGEEPTLKSVMEDFLVASRTADLVEAGDLSIRTVQEKGRTSIVLSEDRVTALIEAGDEVGGLATDDESFLDAVHEAIEAEWADASVYQLRTPALSRITETLEMDLQSAVREDFEGILEALETAKGNGTGLDEVTISLLVAAKNNVLLYDISKWGEDVGIASKATFSRTKTKLEEEGLIDTEKVPIDVGRPRLRLKLQDERLRDAEPAEMAEIAAAALSN